MVVAALLSKIGEKPQETSEIAVRTDELKIPLHSVSRSNEADECICEPLQIVAEGPHFSNRRKFPGALKNGKGVGELQESFQSLRQQLQWEMVKAT